MQNIFQSQTITRFNIPNKDILIRVAKVPFGSFSSFYGLFLKRMRRILYAKKKRENPAYHRVLFFTRSRGKSVSHSSFKKSIKTVRNINKGRKVVLHL